MSDQYDEIWKRHAREKVSPVELAFDRYTVNGEPACMAWYGVGGHDRMACFFLAVSRFGSKHHCLYCDGEIYPSANDMLKPLDGCPLWPTK